jgi:hypothetical protein
MVDFNNVGLLRLPTKLQAAVRSTRLQHRAALCSL